MQGKYRASLQSTDAPTQKSMETIAELLELGFGLRRNLRYFPQLPSATERMVTGEKFLKNVMDTYNRMVKLSPFSHLANI